MLISFIVISCVVILGRWMAKINSEEVQSLENFISRINEAFNSIQLAAQINQVRCSWFPVSQDFFLCL